MSLKDRLNLTAEPLFLMDGSAFIYRGFFANRNLQRSDGFPTNALVVVGKVLLRILRGEAPKHFLFIKDGRGTNFRHDIYPLYKANREAMPENLVCQLDPIKRLVLALGLPYAETEGFEADDGIASLAARFAPSMPVVIISGDKDLKQCLGPNVYMWDPATKEEKLTDAAAFTAESGVEPQFWPDVQALIGDTSDNIPGVPGIGPKTAQQIFSQCANLEEIRDHLDRLTPKLQDKLRPHLEAMFTWRQLTRLSREQWPDMGLDAMAVQPPHVEDCEQLATEFELVALRRDMRALFPTGGESAKAPAAAAGNGQSGRTSQPKPSSQAVQGSLFDETPAAPASPQVPYETTEAWDVAALPACSLMGSGGDVAVVGLPGQTLHLAVAGVAQEFVWTGEPSALKPWLLQAGRLIVPDAKALMVASPLWREVLEGEHARPYFDLGVAAWLISPEEGDYAWPRLAACYGAALGNLPPARLALALAQKFAQGMRANGLQELYDRLELPLIPVLAGMERQGIAIAPAAFRAFLDEVQGKLDDLTREVHAQAGKPFNIRSAQQLGEILFDELKLGTSKKTRGGQHSTSQQNLEKLAGQHPLVDLVLQFRKLEKMRSTYLEPLPRLMDGANRIHTTFNQKGTATGRLSSRDPNLQNIPVRGELGKRMRTCFVPATGKTLISADYSQVELRVLAHMSQDAALLHAFHQGEDIHAHTAALIFDLPQAEVTADQRRSAKTINFGLIYGMGAQKLGQELKISVNEAKAFIERYFASLTGLKAFYENVEHTAKAQGYVTTLTGRRRPLPDINSNNGQASALARRQAVNTVIQGSAADIIKLAMLAVAHDAELRRLGATLLLQVHDELLLEAPQETAQAVAERTAQLMAAVAPQGQPLSVPLLVDWGVGPDWGAAH